MSFIVAIDGPAGSGKGTITKLVGKKMNLENIDTGAMYRCVSLDMIRKNIKLNEIDKIESLLKTINIKLKKDNGIDKFYLNGEDVTKLIRTKEVNEIVSQVSHILIVREAMVNFQRNIARDLNIIMEGRDIGTNVFPNADVKIYLDASAEERARRRVRQNEEAGISSNYEEILENIKFRDNNDKTSKVAPLKQAEDAIYVDTTNMNIEEVVEKIINIIEKKKNK
ncbi:MAG TPA: (d)CMP kinase [Candidatus Scatovivens faecipullorum]|nr:(d)CMP kinase [Candidatus Scatovivens faecipullorum]